MHELHKLCTSFLAVCTLWISIDREVIHLPLLVELEFENDGFWGEGKTGVHVTGERSLGAKERISQDLKPAHIGGRRRAITDAPSLAPY